MWNVIDCLCYYYCFPSKYNNLNSIWIYLFCVLKSQTKINAQKCLYLHKKYTNAVYSFKCTKHKQTIHTAFSRYWFESSFSWVLLWQRGNESGILRFVSWIREERKAIRFVQLKMITKINMEQINRRRQFNLISWFPGKRTIQGYLLPGSCCYYQFYSLQMKMNSNIG